MAFSKGTDAKAWDLWASAQCKSQKSGLPTATLLGYRLATNLTDAQHSHLESVQFETSSTKRYYTNLALMTIISQSLRGLEKKVQLQHGITNPVLGSIVNTLSLRATGVSENTSQNGEGQLHSSIRLGHGWQRPHCGCGFIGGSTGTTTFGTVMTLTSLMLTVRREKAFKLLQKSSGKIEK